jgi:cytochrome c
MPKAVIQALTPLLLLPFLAAEASAASAQEQRGRSLAVGMCGCCHAVDAAGDSPHLAAPPFRVLGRSLDLARFSQRLREGILTGHPDMPMFRFNGDDAAAFTAYLRSIQTP